MRKAALLLLPPFLLAAAGPGGGAGEASRFWPSWRGPLHTGIAPHGTPPTEWSETRNVRWKVKLPGPGHATPVVWDDRIYVLSAVRAGGEASQTAPRTAGGSSPAEGTRAPGSRPDREEVEPTLDPRTRSRGAWKRPAPTRLHRFVVSAFDRFSGRGVWETTVLEEVPHEPGHVTASQASASPVTDGRHLYASFGSRGIYCLDLDGKVKWEVDLGEMSTRNQFGEGASPVLHGDTLFVNWDHEGDSFLAALDAGTGAERWRVARDERTSWATPLVVEDGDRSLVVVSGTNRVRAYDTRDGTEVWRCGGLGLNCIPTPVAGPDTLFVMSGYREAAGLAIRYPGATGDLTGSEAVAWSIRSGLSYVPSPLLYDGTVYFLERFSGMLTAYDLSSGRPRFTKERLEGLGNIYASPVGADGRIFIVDRNGNGRVLRHGETLEVLARNKLDDAFDASPVIVDDSLYLRGHEHLYRLAAGDD